MTPSDKLFVLIQSLSKSEKRVFKLNASKHKGDKIYLKLFDLIEGQAQYDEESLKAAFKGTKAHARFSREKNHLYDLILKSMSGYQSNRSVHAEVNDMTIRIRFLFSKGLYQQCVPLIKKAQKLALDYELYHILLEIISLKKKVLSKGAYGNIQETSREAREEESQALAAYSNINTYSNLLDELSVQRLLVGRVRQASDQRHADEIIATPELTNINLTTTFDSRFYFLLTHFNYHEFMGNWPMAKQYSGELLALIEQHPRQLEIKFESYLDLFFNHLKTHLREAQAHGFEGRWTIKEAFYEGVQRFKDLPHTALYNKLKSDNLVSWYMTRYYHLHFNYYGHIFRFEPIMAIVDEVSEHLRKYRQSETVDGMIFCLNIAMAAFHSGDFRVSNRWLNKVLNSNIADARSDMYSFAKIFGLIVHYERGNYDLVEYISGSTHRFLNKRNLFYQVEKTLYEFMKDKALYLNTPSKRKQGFRELSKKLEKLMADPREKRIFEIFDFHEWATYHLENRRPDTGQGYNKHADMMRKYGKDI